VIAPNPRGSTGYGRAFEAANHRDLGGGDLADYVAGAKFLVNTGYVDARRIGIAGLSYGGYMTMMALSKTPEVWAAGVEVCGITNWLSIYERGSPMLRQYLVGLLGDSVKDRAVYAASSPLTYLAHVNAPLLALAGGNDIRVPPDEAEQVVKYLRDAGKTVDIKVYAGEGHGFYKRENQIDALERTVAWFDRYMCPTCIKRFPLSRNPQRVLHERWRTRRGIERARTAQHSVSAASIIPSCTRR